MRYYYFQGLKTSRVEALAEIFDFAAGLVQRVPKKPNEVKADLQNSTASQGDDHLHTSATKKQKSQKTKK